jgi:hypothetical protein
MEPPTKTRGKNKMLRMMRLACGPALSVGLLLIGIGAMGISGAAAQQGTPEARQACTPDAMRLCSDFIPDVAKVTRCMMAKRAQLSRECRMAMAAGHGGGKRHYRHYARGGCAHAHC